ncbi:Clp protease N-terminal domain-containing protein [Actinomadura sp. HBU206391]|uniref:Clp protease N-terminal domain-containing protein n=1 Tax=Actinomadura sp. HBU206391 TaxID=2731692 RepID=UPI0021CA4DAC|nr:Clp protease N-terminal domain-containing protein [Actinomadura sp. HBU206391]
MLARFTPAARETMIRAGRLAAEAGRDRLGTGFLLLALAEARPVGPRLEDLGVTAAEVRTEIERRHDGVTRRPDAELLAALGIDLEEVRRRLAAATSTRPGDPALWRLRRSPLRPLRVTLTGPATDIVLDEGGRKVAEVAIWAARRAGRGLADRDDLLWGLLADGGSESVRILRSLDIDVRRLWTGLQDGHAAA